MKKFKWGVVGLAAMLMLTACGKKDDQQSKSSDSVKTEKTAKSKHHTEYKMDFAQIKKGNFSGLKGNWREVARRENYHDMQGLRNKIGDGHALTIKKHAIINDEDLTLKDEKLYFQDQEHPVEYNEKNGSLSISVLNGASAINRAIIFYPKGTTDHFKSFFKGKTNPEDVIVVWSSDFVVEKIFVRNPKNIESYRPKVELYNSELDTDKPAETENKEAQTQKTKTKKVGSTALNLQQILNNNFDSLIGTWTQKKGDSFVISGKVVSDSRDANRKGIVIDNKTEGGYPVILRGEAMNGQSLTGSKGTFNPKIQNSPFSPIMFVPAGVKIADNDDSDISRDRLVDYFGSEGYDNYVYYRQ